MVEYVEREALVSDLEFLARHQDGFRQSVILGVVHTINCVPAADVAPVVHGRWLDTGYYGHSKSPIYMCSNCRKEVEDYYIKNHKFCLHCGARMDGE